MVVDVKWVVVVVKAWVVCWKWASSSKRGGGRWKEVVVETGGGGGASGR